jgi:ribosomal protein S18
MLKVFNNNLKLLGRLANKQSQQQIVEKRTIHMTNLNQLKKLNIVEDKQSKQITIEASYIDPVEAFGNKALEFNNEASSDQNDLKTAIRPCAFCELEKRDIFVQYTDVLVLRQFLKEDGTPLNRKVTGLCRKQQKKLLVMAKHARIAGLTLNLQPNLIDGSKRSSNPRTRSEHLKWNTSFDDYEIMRKTHKYL